MRLVTFKRAGRLEQRLGVLREDGAVVDLAATDPLLEGGMLALVAAEPAMLERARAAAKHGSAVEGATLCAPIPRPPKNVFCVGKNYHEHAKEFAGSGFDASTQDVVPEAPVVFSKPATSIIGPGEPIPAGLDPDRLGGLRGRARRRHRPRRARHPQGGGALPRLRLHDRQRRHGAHAAAPAPAVDPRQGHRRLLPDGSGDAHRGRGARLRARSA